MTIQNRLAEIDEELARLGARKRALQREAAEPWPKRLLLYAHCSRETNWEKGEALGLAGEALQLFVHFEEIELWVEVTQDGDVTVLRCNDRQVDF